MISANNSPAARPAALAGEHPAGKPAAPSLNGSVAALPLSDGVPQTPPGKRVSARGTKATTDHVPQDETLESFGQAPEVLHKEGDLQLAQLVWPG